MYNLEQKKNDYEKQKSYKGWDFLDACTSEQFNLLKEVLFIDDKRKSLSIWLMENGSEWKEKSVRQK